MATFPTGMAVIDGYLFGSVFMSAKYTNPIIGNMIWRATADTKKVSNEKHLDVGVVCLQENDASDEWSCGAEIEFRAWSEEGEEISKTVNFCFKNSAMKCVVENFCALKSLCNDGSQFRIVAEIRMKPKVRKNFEMSQNVDGEIVLLVGDKKLYVDKFLLMSHSPLFREMLSSETNAKKEIEIKDVKYEVLVELLRFLNLEQPTIKYENAADFLALADRYGIQSLMEYCEQYMINVDPFCVVTKLQLSEQYNLKTLQKEAIKTITKDEMADIFEIIDECNFGAQLKEALIMKSYRLNAESMHDEPIRGKFYHENKLVNTEIIQYLATVSDALVIPILILVFYILFFVIFSAILCRWSS